MPDANGQFEVDIVMPYRLLPPIADIDVMIWQVSAQQVSSVGNPEPSTELKLAIEKITEI